jgi:hypothetical protein
MALCAYGSEPNPDAPPYVWATWIDAKNWLSGLWLPLAWAAAASKAILHDTAIFCATEPTQPVAPDAATIVAASHDPLAFEQLVQYIEQSAGWWVWHNVCRCKANPDSSCVDTSFTSNGQTWIAATAVGVNLEWGSRFTAIVDCGVTGIGGYSRASGDLSNRDLHLWDGSGTPLWTQNGYPTPAGHWQLNFGTSIPMAAGETWTVSETTLSSSTVAQLQTGSPDMPSNAFFTWGVPYYALSSNTYPTNTGGSNRLSIMPITCGTDSSPYTPDPPPVPDVTLPDYPLLECEEGDICILLQQLRAELTQQKTLITLIQRQAVPFAWITGTVHSGLTGSGSFTVQGILGLRVTYTTVPSYWGISSDNPNRYIPAPGSIAFAFTAGGSEDTHWINVVDQVVLQLGDATPTLVRYHFKPGVTATITELVREA